MATDTMITCLWFDHARSHTARAVLKIRDYALLGRGGCRARIGVPEAACPECDVDESDEDGYFDQWPDDAGERFAGGGAEDADGDRDRELEVVGGDGEAHARTLEAR